MFRTRVGLRLVHDAGLTLIKSNSFLSHRHRGAAGVLELQHEELRALRVGPCGGGFGVRLCSFCC